MNRVLIWYSPEVVASDPVGPVDTIGVPLLVACCAAVPAFIYN